MSFEAGTGLSRSSFPERFVWGAATAAYQIEGAHTADGRGPSIWDVFSHTPGKTYQGASGDIACDHYNRYRQDIAHIKNLGFNAYRFSISWPRVLPQGRGMINPKGLDFYDRLVEELLQNDIQPYATLYHWDLPQALQAEGGWKVRSTSQYFAEYADKVSRRLGDRVKGWITLNEPWVSAYLGYVNGEHAPGEKDFGAGVKAGHHLMLGHGLALPVLRHNVTRPDAEFGITLNINYVEPGNDSSQAQEATRLAKAFAHNWFLDPIFKGQYPEALAAYFNPHLPIEPGDMEIISGTLDFLGVNYYFRDSVLAIEDTAIMKLKTRQPAESQYTAMGWEVYPEGLYRLLKSLHQEYAPAKIYITENGAAFEDRLEEDQSGPVVHDPDRLKYIRDHLEAASQAIAEDVPLAGYFAWSLMDNFEWAHGYSKRFGIMYTDYPTQRRILKDSGKWLRQLVQG